LQNVIERAVILCADGEQLQPAHFGFNGAADLGAVIGADGSTASTPIAPGSPDEVIPLSDVEKRYILEILQKCSGNRTHAARKLGISIRTLRNRLTEYGIALKDEEEAEPPAD
jgi:DNA-binding NtrC family response regulator